MGARSTPARKTRRNRAFVVPEMDAGPVVAQEAIEVRDNDTARNIGRPRAGDRARIYPRALKLLAEGRISPANPGGIVPNDQ